MYLKQISLLILVIFPTLVLGDCTCDSDATRDKNGEALKLKIGAIASILFAGAVGVSLPLLGRRVAFLRPEHHIFFMIKAFAAGVILATGFIHILPDAFDDLTSPCLDENPWGKFPFTGFAAMMSAIVTLMIDSFATGYYKRLNDRSANKQQVTADAESGEEPHCDHTGVHTHGHAHGSAAAIMARESVNSELIRHRIIAQVLELGIIVHSVIIGISLGASQTPSTIKPLIAALSFHQFFEGMGLGGCISQARLKIQSMAIMAAFFSLTTPVGVGIGIGISSIYNENSPNALIIEGLFNASAAGILIYMSLVDLLAPDFMNPIIQNNSRLQLGVNVSLLLGAGCMSLLAKWA